MLITGIGSVMPFMVKIIVRLEKWNPSIEFQIYICQIYILKMINLGVIFYELNRQTHPQTVQQILVAQNRSISQGAGGYGGMDQATKEAEHLLCWETFIGIYVWKLIFSSM